MKAEVLDGRRNRTVTTRKKIVQAFFELIREGHLEPTAEDVSVRAKMGIRTVFRHFDDMETLYGQVNAEMRKMVTAMLPFEYRSVQWQERLLESLEARYLLFEAMTPFFMVAQLHRHKSAVINTNVKHANELERTILKNLIPKETQADESRFEALCMLLSLEAWIRLRREQGLSFNSAMVAVQVALKALAP